MAYTNGNGQARVGVRIVPLSVVIPTTSALLDSYSGAVAAYSLRKLKSSYGGSAIRVRRSSDNTEQNIGFDSVGNLDTYSLSAFVGTGNGFVTTWYDQSGNNRDATQTTAGNQPIIVSSGIIINLNNKSSIYFNGSSFMNTIQNVLSVGNGGYSVFGLGRPGGSPNCLFYIGSSTGNNGVGLNNNNGTPRHYWFANDYDSGQTFVNTNSIFVISYDGTKRYTTINNVTTSANSSGKNTTNPTLSIGRLPGYSQNLVGYESELVIYDLNKESIRTNITNDINSYYSVYPNPTSVWNLLNAVYSADTTASSSLKTSLFAAYNGESNANDSFGTNNGTAMGGLTYATGKIGNAFSFNGTTSYVSLPTNSLSSLTGDFSISFWMMANDSNPNGGMIFSNLQFPVGLSTYYGWQVSLGSGQIYFISGSNTGNSTASTRLLSSALSGYIGTWVHVTCTHKQSTGYKIYVNGVLNNSNNGTYNPVYTTNHTPSIGAQYSVNASPNLAYPFNGSLDALSVWSKELTQSEITELYNSGNGAQYIGDNFYKPTTNDALNTYNGTAQGGLTYVQGKVGTAFQFNGTNAYVSLPTSSFNNLTGDFSVSCWFKTNTVSGYQLIFSNLSYNGGARKGFYIILSTNTIGCWLVNQPTYSQEFYTSSVVSINTWYYLSVTRESGVVKIYLNGTLLATDTNAIPLAYVTTLTSIGAYTNGLTPILYYFNGNIDAFSIWQKALTQAEVTELYNSGNGKQYPN